MKKKYKYMKYENDPEPFNCTLPVNYKGSGGRLTEEEHNNLNFLMILGSSYNWSPDRMVLEMERVGLNKGLGYEIGQNN
jgi:hypothetical protein